MDKRPYHHGDLRRALIEAGINLINEKGVSQFSLRKVALACNVSHNAPYAHFKDMDSLMAAMSEHVSQQFMESLTLALKEVSGEDDTMLALGKAYIQFFTEHPNYFQFLFYHSGVSIDLNQEEADDFMPFALFRATAYKSFVSLGVPTAARKKALISLWSLVHGITALLTNKNVQYSGDWREIMNAIDINVRGTGQE